jgi:hypothetical protein
LIEGVNTAAENVIIYDRRKSKNVLDFFTYKNIQGRAGRMGKYFVGKVFVLEKPPDDEEFVVDYAVDDQNSDTPLSLLMQLDDKDLTSASKERVAEELKKSRLLTEATLRLNGKRSDWQGRSGGGLLLVRVSEISSVERDLRSYRKTSVWAHSCRLWHRLGAPTRLAFKRLQSSKGDRARLHR